jgi:hypothetical protein
MRMLILLERSPRHRFLVSLHTENLIREIKRLVYRKKYTQAIVTALSKGTFEEEVAAASLPCLQVGLILSEDSASWDLSK